MPLIIIESPNKVQKIKQYTGYEVIATIGHFMDLTNIDVENSYSASFEYTESKKSRIMHAINKAKNEIVYIATDPDREGYAIGYMFYQKIKNVAKTIYRAEFHEITPSGIKNGLDNAKLFVDTNFNYYQSFLGRRISDQLIGFILSPYLTRALESKTMLSAGRVQTPALSLIAKREAEIKAFQALSDDEKREYALCLKTIIGDKAIEFKHVENGKEMRFATKDEPQRLLNELTGFDKALVSSISTSPATTNPPKPFTTSRLLKAASKKLNISTKEIQNLAQELFAKGLITYIRTDSEFISQEFLQEMQRFYAPLYPDTYAYTEYKAGKNSQAEAHEAIRITHCHRYEEIASICAKEGLESKHIKLYTLIFENTLCSQSKSAVYEKTEVLCKCKMTEFKTSFRKIVDKGFLGLFTKASNQEEEQTRETEEESMLTFPYKERDMIPISQIFIKDIDKAPPKRYLEADFIEVMEKAGIGRPSTYATFLPLLLNKEYIQVSQDKKREIIPTALGNSVINFFTADKNAWILDLDFTKHMEDSLDEIMGGSKKYVEYMQEVHAKMDFIPLKKEPKEKKDYPPSPKQIKFCQDIASTLGIELPQRYDKDYKIAGEFITKNLPKMPKKEKPKQ